MIAQRVSKGAAIFVVRPEHVRTLSYTFDGVQITCKQCAACTEIFMQFIICRLQHVRLLV